MENKYILRLEWRKFPHSNNIVKIFQDKVFDMLTMLFFKEVLKEFYALPKEKQEDTCQAFDMYEGTKEKCEELKFDIIEMRHPKFIEFVRKVKGNPLLRVIPSKLRKQFTTNLYKADNNKDKKEKVNRFERLQMALLVIGIYIDIDVIEED